jgi:Zn-dependent peptidase ImmA (M78 family)
MATRVPVPGPTLIWAQERSRVPMQQLVRKFPRLPDWISGVAQPTMKQLQGFATATYTPIGYFFLPTPPDEPVPLPDFRTMGNQAVRRPSPHLLETIFECQRRQEWYRENARAIGEPAPEIVGSYRITDDPRNAADDVRIRFDYDPGHRGGNPGEAFRLLSERAEDAGVLVMTSGIVGSNSHRKLDPREFRGFALVDRHAPTVFVNGADTKAAQIFTLVHELAHVLLGQSGLDDLDLRAPAKDDLERWCNQFAAEFLVPAPALRSAWQTGEMVPDESSLKDLAARFRVSTLVILNRLHALRLVSDTVFSSAYAAENNRIQEVLLQARSSGGGNFYATQTVRTSRRFTRSLIASTLEGQTLYRDAFQMLGFRKQSTFDELANRLGIA